MNTTRQIRVGLFGLEAYWPQFEERLGGYFAQVADKLTRPGVEICNAGLVDSPERAADAGAFSAATWASRFASSIVEKLCRTRCPFR